jgi:DNA-binding response OmpR family regulator
VSFSSNGVPVLIMSAKDEDVDKALGLGLGADDYISKPFSMLEVIALERIILKHSIPSIFGSIKSNNITSNFWVFNMSKASSHVDKALGLGLGADDYISKPFSMLEVIARIKATIRRKRFRNIIISPEAETKCLIYIFIFCRHDKNGNHTFGIKQPLEEKDTIRAPCLQRKKKSLK